MHIKCNQWRGEGQRQEGQVEQRSQLVCPQEDLEITFHSSLYTTPKRLRVVKLERGWRSSIALINEARFLITTLQIIDGQIVRVDPRSPSSANLSHPAGYDIIKLSRSHKCRLHRTGGHWHILTGAAFLSFFIPLLVFFGFQRYFVRGLVAGSVKG